MTQLQDTQTTLIAKLLRALFKEPIGQTNSQLICVLGRLPIHLSVLSSLISVSEPVCHKERGISPQGMCRQYLS